MNNQIALKIELKIIKVGCQEMKYYERKNYTGLLYISPWIFGFLLFKLYPFVMSLVYSFTEFNILDKPKFIGFDNSPGINYFFQL